MSLDTINFIKNSLKLIFKFFFFFVDHVYREVFSFEVATWVTDLLGSLTFVTSKHPNFDTSFSKVLNAFNNHILKHIFNSSNSQNSEILLDFMISSFYFVLANLFHSVD